MACTETYLVRCPDCTNEEIKRNGKSKSYRQRYYCKWCGRSFQTTYPLLSVKAGNSVNDCADDHAQ
jgi:transposase-like protein